MVGGKSGMSVAIGMLCAEGVVIAADQAVALGDGSKTNHLKVASGWGRNCSFAIANSTEDGNAALTLQGKIVRALESIDPTTHSLVEEIVVETMTGWAQAYGTPPVVQFLLGVFCSSVLYGEGGPALFYCEPPNTFLRREVNDDSRGYDAIGSGSAVTTPLHTALFRRLGNAKHKLSEISYLMDKAKQGNIYCGGRTNAILVRAPGQHPDWISPLDMEVAEGTARHLDFFLSWTGACLFGQTDEGVGQLADGLADAIKTNGRALRGMRFHTMTGDEIYDTSVQAFDSTKESAD